MDNQTQRGGGHGVTALPCTSSLKENAMSNEPSPTLPKMTPEENIKPTCRVVRPEYRPGCWTYCCVIGFALIVLVWFNIFRSGPPLRIAKETTYITEPLTPDGRFVDYFAALEQRVYPPAVLFGRSTGIATDDNGYRVVFRALGDFMNETKDFELLKQRYEKLGLDVNRDKLTLTYIEPGEYFKNRYFSHPGDFQDIIAKENAKHALEKEEELQRQIAEAEAAMVLTANDREEIIAYFRGEFQYSFDPSDYWQLLQQSPDLHQNVIVQEWLEENNAALNLLAEQVNKPVFVTPYIVGHTAFQLLALMAELYHDFRSMQALVHGLQTRALIRLGQGDIDGAMDDILACYHLGRHIEKQATHLEGAFGMAFERIAGNIPYYLNTETRANTEQLKRLQKGVAALSPQKGWGHKLEYQRFVCLDSITWLMRGVDADIASGATAARIFGLDWNLGFKKINKVFDEIEAGTYTYPQPSMNLASWLTLKGRSEALADTVIAMVASPIERRKDDWPQNDCAMNMNMKRIVLAMYLYEREHGTLPSAFSVDETSGKPLHGWRTLLLPYFGDEELADLYAQIRLDEPWDSEHNRQFHERNLDIYRCPSNASMLDGDTSYSVIIGDGLLFTNDGHGQTLAGHGPNMLLVVEHQESVCWMRPNAEISQTDAESGIGSSRRISGIPIHGGPITYKSVATTTTIRSNHSGGCNFGLLDGGVTFISETIANETFVDLVRGTAKERP